MKKHDYLSFDGIFFVAWKVYLQHCTQCIAQIFSNTPITNNIPYKNEISVKIAYLNVFT